MKKKIASLISISLLATLLSGCNEVGKISYKKEVKAKEFAEKIVEKWNKTNFAKNLGAYDFENDIPFDVKSDIEVKAYVDVVMEENAKATYFKNKTSNYEEHSKTEVHASGTEKTDVESGNISQEIKTSMTSSSTIKDKTQNEEEKGHGKAEGSIVSHYEKEEGNKFSVTSFDLIKKEYEKDYVYSTSSSIAELFTINTLGSYNVESYWALFNRPQEEIAEYFELTDSKLYVDGNKFTFETIEEQSKDRTEGGVTNKETSNYKYVNQLVFEKNTLTFVEYATEESSETVINDICEVTESYKASQVAKMEFTLKKCNIKTPKEDKFLEVSSISTIAL